jgi:alkylation response protein AidB-like acyl-CoA dehydrogenase
MGRRMNIVTLGAPPMQHARLLESIASRAKAAETDIDRMLALAIELGEEVPLPSSGSTLQLWDILATIGAADLTVARVCEPHLDAVSILSQAGIDRDLQSSWGVFAAEAPGTSVIAALDAEQWCVSGTKAWCSLARYLDRALITARTESGGRRLLEIDLNADGIVFGDEPWVSRGLAAVASGSIKLDKVVARLVGGDEWYLTRPGFSWGGMGVAAIWFGASVALARRFLAFLASRDPDQVGLLTLGEIDLNLRAARLSLASAAIEVDGGSEDFAVLAQRVRSTVSRAAEEVLRLVGHGLGPGPLATDERHARRVADLQMYLRQDHAERDVARLGAKLYASSGQPW